jgi:hypothetical protein
LPLLGVTWYRVHRTHLPPDRPFKKSYNLRLIAALLNHQVNSAGTIGKIVSDEPCADHLARHQLRNSAVIGSGSGRSGAAARRVRWGRCWLQKCSNSRSECRGHPPSGYLMPAA